MDSTSGTLKSRYLTFSDINFHGILMGLQIFNLKIYLNLILKNLKHIEVKKKNQVFNFFLYIQYVLSDYSCKDIYQIWLSKICKSVIMLFR